MNDMHSLGEFVALRQGLAINKGTAHLVSEKKDENYVYPLLRIADMESGKYEKYISKSVQDSVIANEDDIVYTRTGQIGLAFRGYSGCVHNNSFIVSLTSEDIDKDYLFVLLNSKFVRQQALSLAKNSVQPDLTHDMFKSILIPVPDINEQKRIASIILTICNKILNNNTICADIEGMAKLLYDYWFVQFDFPDENGKPYKSSGGKMVWNEELKREIPEGWKKGCLGDIMERYTNGILPSEIGSLPYTPMDVLPMKKMSFSDTGNQDDANSSLIRYSKYTILFGAMRPYFHRVCIAPFDGITRTTVFTIKEKYKDELGYAYETLNQDYCVDYANAHHVGTQQPYAEWENNLENCPIPIPPHELRVRYSNIIANCIDSVISTNMENQELASLRDFLLPMLMNGQVKVKKGENQ